MSQTEKTTKPRVSRMDKARMAGLRKVLLRIAPPDRQRGEPSLHQLSIRLGVNRISLQKNLRSGYLTPRRIPDLIRIAHERGLTKVEHATFLPFLKDVGAVVDDYDAYIARYFDSQDDSLV